MKRRIVWIGILLAACTSSEKPDPIAANDTLITRDSLKQEVKVSDTANSINDTGERDEMVINEFQTFHVVTVAEGYDFDSLNTIAQEVSKKLQAKIDFMNKSYDVKKGMVLPMDDEDEMYRGEYFPRRYAGDFISIEMRSAYSDTIEKIPYDDLKMVVIAGIFEEKYKADSVLSIIKSDFQKSKVITRDLFIGCMH